MTEEYSDNGINRQEREAWLSLSLKRGDKVSYRGVAGYVVRGLDPLHDSVLISRPCTAGSAARVRVSEVVRC